MVSFNILIHEMLADDHGDGVHNHLCIYDNNFERYWETKKMVSSEADMEFVLQMTITELI